MFLTPPHVLETLSLPIQTIYGLDQVEEALRAFGTAHTQGKLGIQMT